MDFLILGTDPPPPSFGLFALFVTFLVAKQAISSYKSQTIWLTHSQTFSYICQYPPISANICQYLPISANNCQYLPISANICQYLSLSALICPYLPCINSYTNPYQVHIIRRFLRGLKCWFWKKYPTLKGPYLSQNS